MYYYQLNCKPPPVIISCLHIVIPTHLNIIPHHPLLEEYDDPAFIFELHMRTLQAIPQYPVKSSSYNKWTAWFSLKNCQCQLFTCANLNTHFPNGFFKILHTPQLIGPLACQNMAVWITITILSIRHTREQNSWWDLNH